ncbi:hypothetical protein CAI21_04990 [Alkalilimnicola ehrlichii]|uniref:DUF481 domain-containing protein n=1 Tax=Alkalilimnicola ehrlichii TaxID=351052 RepID=A0A3E0X120_9GAMM|nr:DUF481 domain-containing protein [Alkalilimnicola ehrlichii]RFA30434.1 hypothetical protein CAI21_04990 [Alkalilimnicola ehrlichii]RFA37986.1 hypothetical protein CAL65_06365 [Alkalilimnicola ehrlichii]
MIQRRLISAGLAGCLFAATAQADILVLKNGDRYSGEVVSMEDGNLRFTSDYGHTFTVPWSDVSAITTDDKVHLVLEDESWVKGRLAESNDGRAELHDNGALEPVGFPLAAVTAINPPEGPHVPPVRTEGRINFGARKTSGNTETESFSGDIEFVARTINNRYTLGAEANYGKDDGVRNKNDVTGFARYDHFVDDRWYLNSNVRATRDEFRNLSLRTNFGVGLGYQFLETARQRLSFESGVNYVHETFRDDTSDSRPAGRLAADYEHRFGMDDLSLFHRNEVLLGLDDIQDLMIRSRTGLRFPLIDRLTGTVQVNHDYDRSPAAGNQRTDVTYLLTLGYGW